MTLESFLTTSWPTRTARWLVVYTECSMNFPWKAMPCWSQRRCEWSISRDFNCISRTVSLLLQGFHCTPTHFLDRFLMRLMMMIKWRYRTIFIQQHLRCIDLKRHVSEKSLLNILYAVYNNIKDFSYSFTFWILGDGTHFMKIFERTLLDYLVDEYHISIVIYSVK